WQIDGRNYLFTGINNVNYDYFVSDVTSLFTNSSCGIFPTVAANSPVANYPVAAIGVHYRYDVEHWQLQASAYNGSGHNKFAGRDNMFRVCPQSDGIFTLAQIVHKRASGNYFLGASYFYGCLDESRDHIARSTVWVYAEQKLSDRLSLIADYSRTLHGTYDCREFVGLGAKYSAADCEWGLFTDYARFAVAQEWATEVTCNIHLSDVFYVQPALHFIRTDDHRVAAGLLRFGVSL
ncbi:MAG: hypothetical protein IKR18_00375, partial [Bacteroidaceae bacterium]|nr:hypothetical protein [Bacteroidaceae bacterium]